MPNNRRNYCLVAYNPQRCHDPGNPKPGTPIAEFIGVQSLRERVQSLK